MELLITVHELSVWAREEIDEDEPFAVEVMKQLDEILREAGNPLWTRETLPRRARRMALELAKAYYLNPDILVQETTGPLGERRLDGSVRVALEFTEDERAELEELAGVAPKGRAGLWVASTTRGPVEMHNRPRYPDVAYVPVEQGALTAPPQPIAFIATDDTALPLSARR